MEHILRRKEEREKFLERRKHLPTGTFTVVIDFSYTTIQTDQEMKSLRNQVNHSYGFNAHAPIPVPLHLTSFTGRIKDYVTQLTGFSSWNIATHEEHFLECFPREKIVYLTSDSPELLETLDPEAIYIIGGMVDHNRLKVYTYTYVISFLSRRELPMQMLKRTV